MSPLKYSGVVRRDQWRGERIYNRARKDKREKGERGKETRARGKRKEVEELLKSAGESGNLSHTKEFSCLQIHESRLF